MKKTLLSLVLALIMVFSCCSVAFAEVSTMAVEPRATSSMNISVGRDSGTKGGATVDVNFVDYVSSYTVHVYLQKLSNNSWVNDTSNEDYYKYATGSNRNYTIFDVDYDKLTYGTAYRIKVVSKTTYNGKTYTSSGYSQTF